MCEERSYSSRVCQVSFLEQLISGAVDGFTRTAFAADRAPPAKKSKRGKGEASQSAASQRKSASNRSSGSQSASDAEEDADSRKEQLRFSVTAQQQFLQMLIDASTGSSKYVDKKYVTPRNNLKAAGLNQAAGFLAHPSNPCQLETKSHVIAMDRVIHLLREHNYDSHERVP